jgi:hypothetical protein
VGGAESAPERLASAVDVDATRIMLFIIILSGVACGESDAAAGKQKGKEGKWIISEASV